MANIKLNFTIKPFKKTRNTNASSRSYKILYCQPIIKDDTLLAKVNTRGVEGYSDTLVIPFTNRSFFTKNRIHVFSKEKDKTNHYAHIIRNKLDARFPTSKNYSPLCVTSVYKGRIVKNSNGELQFDMIDYIGHIRKYERYINTERSESDEY